MRFSDILYEYVILENLGAERLQKIAKKWGIPVTSENPNVDTAKKFVDWFREKNANFLKTDPKTQALIPNQPQVRTFLYKYNLGESDFPVTQLKNIEAYTLEQIKFLYDEFNAKEDEITEENRLWLTNPEANRKNPNKLDRSVNQQKIDASKELWHGTKNLVFESNGLRVYEIKDRETSIKYGYYLQYLNGLREIKNQNPDYYVGQWCVTHTDLRSNYYQSKRADRSFYYIIDDKRSPIQNPTMNYTENMRFYLSALQPTSKSTPTRLDFLMTPMNNPGEPAYTVQEIERIYPELRNNLNRFVYTKYNPDGEQLFEERVLLINEIAGNPNNFIGASKAMKNYYIGLGKNVTKKESWLSMDENLKRTYINRSHNDKENNDSDYIFNKFNYEIFSEIDNSKETSAKTTLKERIDNLTDGKQGIGLLRRHYITKEFKDYKGNLLNDNIVIVKGTSNNYGIMIKKEGFFLKQNGVLYDGVYKKSGNASVFFDANNRTKQYMVEKFVTSGNDENSFYLVSALLRPQVGYIFSHNNWNNIEKSVTIGFNNKELNLVVLNDQIINDNAIK